MAKKAKKKRGARKVNQRAKFKAAAKTCQAEIRNDGVIAFSREQWTRYGKCMKREL